MSLLDALRRLLRGSDDPPAQPPPRAPAPPPFAARPGRADLGTDVGIFGVWVPQAFAHVVDHATWEPELLEDEDIQRHIRAGHFVPVGIRSDGIFGFEVRVGTAHAPAAPTDRERRYLTDVSAPYLLRSSGTVHVSGLEHVNARVEDDHVMAVAVPPGDYAVTVHLLAWDAEPGALDPDDHPTADALPDFLVLANPTSRTEGFGDAVQPFDGG